MGMATTVTAALLLSLAAGPCPARGGSAVAAATRHRLDSVRSRHLAPVTVPTAVTYSLPVALSLRVLRGFDSTTTHYGAGHRGLDLQVSPDLRVLAAADGVVSFAGSVAGRGCSSCGIATVSGPSTNRYACSSEQVHTCREGPRSSARRPSSRLPPGVVPALGRSARGELPRSVDVARATRPGSTAPLARGMTERGSGPRVCLFVGPAQSLDRDVGVDLCRGKIGVTQQFLDRAQVGPAVEQMGGGTMP